MQSRFRFSSVQYFVLLSHMTKLDTHLNSYRIHNHWMCVLINYIPDLPILWSFISGLDRVLSGYLLYIIAVIMLYWADWLNYYSLLGCDGKYEDSVSVFCARYILSISTRHLLYGCICCKFMDCIKTPSLKDKTLNFKIARIIQPLS